MHLPVGVQYLCICPDESLLDPFYLVEESIFVEFGIKLNVQLKSLNTCIDLIKTDTDRSFVIILNVENPMLLAKMVKDLHTAIEKSPCNHKLGIIDYSSTDDPNRQIYLTLLTTLNLSVISSQDGYFQSFSISFVESSSIEFKSTLISTFSGPRRVELANIQPIILDMNLCGVLTPSLYFIARDFGTCIAKILLPDESEWKLAYLIQCDDSGRNDLDMVKVCLVRDEVSESSVPSIEKTTKTDSVLSNPRYPLCRTISNLLSCLKGPDSDILIPSLIQVVSDALAFANQDNADIFPDVDGRSTIEIRKKYHRLFIEILPFLTDVKDHRESVLKVLVKNVRRMVNFLGRDINVTAKTPKKFVNTHNWLKDAIYHSDPESRYWGSVKTTRKQRIENEERNGIISMPLLEPYLPIHWPTSFPTTTNNNNTDSIMEAHMRNLRDHEHSLLMNKRFGV